jgi:hypothetical protein
MFEMNRLRELSAELFMPATTDAADIEWHRQHNKNADYWLARIIDSITCAGSTTGARACKWAVPVLGRRCVRC